MDFPFTGGTVVQVMNNNVTMMEFSGFQRLGRWCHERLRTVSATFFMYLNPLVPPLALRCRGGFFVSMAK